MTKFIVRRLILGFFIVFFGSLVAYAVIRSLPTSFVERMARQLSSLPGAKSYAELINQLNKMYGLDSSVLGGFFKWFGYAMRGEFGYSWKFNQPVIEKFNSVIWYSVVINVFTFILQAVICIPLGILAARKQYSATDYTVTVIALMGISLPTVVRSLRHRRTNARADDKLAAATGRRPAFGAAGCDTDDTLHRRIDALYAYQYA
jgi:peptide/nickel transport system permease protein